MVAQIIQFFVQFLEGDVAGVARDADVDGVDPVAEACARTNQCVASMASCAAGDRA